MRWNEIRSDEKRKDETRRLEETWVDKKSWDYINKKIIWQTGETTWNEVRLDKTRQDQLKLGVRKEKIRNEMRWNRINRIDIRDEKTMRQK